MIGSVNGLVGLCKADQTFLEFHCIIHREQLVTKSLNLDNVMKPVMEIVSYIHTRALSHRQFKNVIAELVNKQKPFKTAESWRKGTGAVLNKQSARYATMVESLPSWWTRLMWRQAV